MARKLDPKIAEVLNAHGFGPEACWDCHGTWVIYHKVLEQIAARAKIKLDPPTVIEGDGKQQIVALCVTGRLGEQSVWSIGEASPKNNKNAYPYAMAEKRAIDRVVLKLIGLHGFAYSEEEADAFVPPPAGKRDITHGVGAEPAGSGQLDVLNPWGEVEAEIIDPKEYLAYLAEKLESVGAYFPPNEHNLIWLGETITDKALKLQCRNVYKLGRDAWAQSPDNPKNKQPEPKSAGEAAAEVVEDLEDDPARLLIP